MSKIYIFSKNEFEIYHNGQNFNLNKFTSLSLKSITEKEQITLSENCCGYLKTLTLLPFTIYGNNYFNTYSLNDIKYINLISLDFENLISEITTKNFNIKIFTNAILVCNNKKCWSYCFKSTDNNYALEIDENLYIFNSFNLIKINTKTLVSTTLITSKLEVNLNKCEILCRIPKTNTHFILFIFDLSENTINIKKLKNDTILNINSLPYLVFYLSKLEFEDVSNYLSTQIQYESLKNYLNNFDDIIEIENEFFIYSKNNFIKINFIIINNIVNEID